MWFEFKWYRLLFIGQYLAHINGQDDDWLYVITPKLKSGLQAKRLAFLYSFKTGLWSIKSLVKSHFGVDWHTSVWELWYLHYVLDRKPHIWIFNSFKKIKDPRTWLHSGGSGDGGSSSSSSRGETGKKRGGRLLSPLFFRAMQPWVHNPSPLRDI